MKFRYRARDEQGRQQRGIVEAVSQEAALQTLDRHGFYVTVLRTEKPRSLFARELPGLSRVGAKDVMLFSRQLSIMFKAQVSLVDSLSVIGRQTKNALFKKQILKLSEQIEGGTALSVAFAQFPKTFSPFYINVVKRGEALGNLSDVLLYLSDYLERSYALKSKIKGAFMYPAFVIVVAFVVMTLLAILVLPNLVSILQQNDQELPLVTVVVVAISTWYAAWWWLVALCMGAGAFGVMVAIRTPRGKKIVDQILLRVPALGSFLRMMYITRFGENLSTLIGGGVSIVQALELTGRIMGNAVYEDVVLEAKDAVANGSKIAEVLGSHTDTFPEIFTQMIAIGEASGTLDTTLVQIVRFYEKEMERAIDRFLGLLEPVLIVVLGLLVGGLMTSLMLPLYQSISQI